MTFPFRPPSPSPARLLARAGTLLLAVACTALLNLNAAQAQDAALPAAGVTPAAAQAEQMGVTFLPLVENVYSGISGDRLGLANGHFRLEGYPAVNSLNAGWYLDWWSRPDPQRPRGIEYAQMVRLHQKLTCPVGTTPDRTLCPYARPHSYTVDPPLQQIAINARTNPGSMWFVGNEMDRRDWPGGHQDEMLPELYAMAYHDIHTVIKEADPTARVAVGAVMQVTDLRRRYLNRIWDAYRDRYGSDLPADMWNIHNYIGSEECSYERVNGRRELVCPVMGVPPGETVLSGAYISESWRHTDHTTFDQQVRRMRQWMKDHGQMDKPLIVSEYGVLSTDDQVCPHPQHEDERLRESARACYLAHPDGIIPLTDPNYVHDFMLWSFDYFLNTKDCSLSAVDDCRLVQRWVWFSLDAAGGFNRHGQLFDVSSRDMTTAGGKFSQWVADNQLALELEP